MISTDTLEDNTAFAKKESADFPLLADPTKKTADQYGVMRNYGAEYGMLANRWTFYIGTDGKILAIDKEVKTDTHGSDVASKLGELGVKKNK